MIKMMDLVKESFVPERRINLMKIEALMQKLIPEIKKEQADKLTELFSEISMMATQMNAIPYTKFNVDAWQVAKLATVAKINEMREETVKISESNKLDCAVFLKALDDVFIN